MPSTSHCYHTLTGAEQAGGDDPASSTGLPMSNADKAALQQMQHQVCAFTVIKQGCCEGLHRISLDQCLKCLILSRFSLPTGRAQGLLQPCFSHRRSVRAPRTACAQGSKPGCMRDGPCGHGVFRWDLCRARYQSSCIHTKNIHHVLCRSISSLHFLLYNSQVNKLSTGPGEGASSSQGSTELAFEDHGRIRCV